MKDNIKIGTKAQQTPEQWFQAIVQEKPWRDLEEVREGFGTVF